MQAFLWILAVLTTLAAGFFTYRADVQRVVPYPWLTALLRTIVAALVWLLLLAPSIHINKQETQKPVIIFLQDESQSIPAALKNDTVAYRERTLELIRRLSSKYRVITRGFGSSLQSDSLFRYRQSATDISAGLARVQEFYGQQNLGAIIVASDGRFNQGLHPLFQNLSLHSSLYSIVIGDSALPRDLRIPQVYANRRVARNSQFEIRADLVATKCAGYRGSIQLLEAGNIVQSNPVSVATDRYDRSVSFTVKAGTPGLHHYVLFVTPADGEQNTANNRKDVFVEVVEEKKNILIAAAAPHPDINALREALAGLETYNVTVRMADQLPASFNGKFGLLQKLHFLWLKHFGKCDRFVGLVYGVIPEFQGKGVDAFMVVEAAKIIQTNGKYKKYEMLWIGDFNPKMINVAENLGTERTRRLVTYRYLFDRNKEFKRHRMLD